MWSFCSNHESASVMNERIWLCWKYRFFVFFNIQFEQNGGGNFENGCFDRDPVWSEPIINAGLKNQSHKTIHKVKKMQKKTSCCILNITTHPTHTCRRWEEICHPVFNSVTPPNRLHPANSCPSVQTNEAHKRPTTDRAHNYIYPPMAISVWSRCGVDMELVGGVTDVVKFVSA